MAAPPQRFSRSKVKREETTSSDSVGTSGISWTQRMEYGFNLQILRFDPEW